LKGLLGSGIGLTMAMWSVSGAAYDIATHALIGEKAYQRSVLNPTDANTVTSVLGFDRLDPLDPFTTSYFDNQATSDTPTQYTRFQQPQETSVFRALIDAGRISGVASVSDLQYRVDGWLMQGDVREDDNDLLIPFTSIYFTQDKRDPDHGATYCVRAGISTTPSTIGLFRIRHVEPMGVCLHRRGPSAHCTRSLRQVTLKIQPDAIIFLGSMRATIIGRHSRRSAIPMAARW
jgi:hypothetical protein